MRASFTLLLLLLVSVLSYSQTNWLQTNGPYGGDDLSIVINSDDEIFIGTKGGGIHNSSDNGNTWIKKNNGLTANLVHALALNSQDHIYAATTEGIFKSTDNGNTW